MCHVQVLHAQVNCFARATLDRSAVYVQQPFKVTYTVLTATWYTEPLEFDNIQVPNAFIIPFTDAQTGRYDVNGKSYPGIQFYYLVFPYKAGSFSVPSINIVATTPPEGSSESVKVTIKTPVLHFVVKPIPKEFPTNTSWMVAKDVVLHEKWNKPLSNLKVGDVIERTVTIDAMGTLPQFIPEFTAEKLPWASVYPQSSVTKDTRTEYDANGERIEKVTYLLTDAGDFTIPGIALQWWNPYSSKMFSRKTPDTKIHIADNPNLGMLTTLQDSLNNTIRPLQTTKEKGPRMIMGMPWYTALCACLLLIALLWIVSKFAIELTRRIISTRKYYLQSEHYWLKRVMKSPSSANEFMKRLYQWWDRVFITGKQASISSTFESQGKEEMKDTFDTYNQQVYQGQQPAEETVQKIKTQVFTYHRKDVPQINQSFKDDHIPSDQLPWKE
ncbi:BatD family protein [Chitinophaga skermanii]|nr:BatD family protein [Chitinophaga skermanii]